MIFAVISHNRYDSQSEGHRPLLNVRKSSHENWPGESEIFLSAGTNELTNKTQIILFSVECLGQLMSTSESLYHTGKQCPEIAKTVKTGSDVNTKIEKQLALRRHSCFSLGKRAKRSREEDQLTSHHVGNHFGSKSLETIMFNFRPTKHVAFVAFLRSGALSTRLHDLPRFPNFIFTTLFVGIS
jgi:hypothetical protein